MLLVGIIIIHEHGLNITPIGVVVSGTT